MARAASTVCSLCEGVGTQRGMDRDGNGGWKHKPGQCKASPAPASPAPASPADLEAGHAERLAAAGLSMGLTSADRADAEAKARVAAKSAPTKASLEKAERESVARATAHRVAVLDFLRPKSPGMSYSPTEIARGSGVLLEEIDVVIKALLASGEIEEIDEEEDEDPSYRAKPSAPALPKPRVNRRGKPAAEAARTCRVCSCTSEKSCDTGAGTCCWTSSKTSPEGDTCSLCAELIQGARERLRDAAAPIVARELEENSPPCVDAKRVGKVIEIVSAELATASKKDRPRDAAKKRNTVLVQPPIPGLGAARELTLPFAAAAAAPTSGTPSTRAIGEHCFCGILLTLDNTSRLPTGALVHVGCSGKAPEPCPDCGSPLPHQAQGRLVPDWHGITRQPPIELSAPCAPCGAASGEACAFATPEPASYIHDARLAALPADERGASRRRAAEDRIRVALDEHAALPGDPPVPTAEGLVRGLVVPGDFDVFTLRDVLGAMIARGEVHEIRCATERAGIPATTYLRRAEGGAPVVMGRTGAMAPREALAIDGYDGTHVEDHCDDCNQSESECLCAEIDPSDRPCITSDVHAPVVDEKPPVGIVPCEACDPCGGGCDREGEPGHREARIGEYVGPDAVPDLLGRSCDPSAPSMREADRPALAAIVSEKAREPAADVIGQALTVASGAQAVASLAADPLSDESPDARLEARIGAIASHVEDVATFICDAAADLAALRAERRATSDQAAVASALHEELADVRAERDELRAALAAERKDRDADGAELASVRAELRLANDRARSAEADRATLRAGINRTGDVLTRAALPGKIGEGCDAAEIGAEMEKLAWASIDREKASLDAYGRIRGALANIAEALGGGAPSDDDELIAEAVSLARRPVSSTALRGALSDVLAGLGAARSAELSDEELGARAVQCAGLFGEAAVNAILELSGEKPTASKPLAEQLLGAARDYGPRAGSFSTELETEVVASTHRLGGIAPIGEGRAALARALRDAVTAALAKKPAAPTPPPITPIRRPWDMPEEKENS